MAGADQRSHARHTNGGSTVTVMVIQIAHLYAVAAATTRHSSWAAHTGSTARRNRDGKQIDNNEQHYIQKKA